MNHWRFEKTSYGWRAYRKHGNFYNYFGHFRTQREARQLFQSLLNQDQL